MKSSLILTTILLLTLQVSFGQNTFDVQDFSKDYYGKLYLDNPTEVFSKGWTAIYQKKTNKLLLKVESDKLVSDFDEENRIKTNILELPYGEQSVIIYEDLNFDKMKDFAIMDGQNSCYGGPSFKVFLGTKNKNKFIFSKSFTRLAQENCGMFKVVPEKKQITTMTKSTCCWHQYSTYIIQNNKPKAIEIIEVESGVAPYNLLYIQRWNGRKMIHSRERMFYDNEFEKSKIHFSFQTENKRRVHLYEKNGSLNYAFINEKDYLELALPEHTDDSKTQFVIKPTNNRIEVSFKNYEFEYVIYETSTSQIGIQVWRKGVLQKDILGSFATKSGHLTDFSSANLDNLRHYK